MLRVAIIDDEPWIVKGIARSCDWQRYGMEVTLAATDPEEAIRRMLADPPDVVLTDVEMGAISGLDLMARLRDAGLACACVVISGYDTFAYAQRAMELGASGYLLKPMRREALESAMERLAASLGRRDHRETVTDDAGAWFHSEGIHTHRQLFARHQEPVACEGWQAALVEGRDAARFLQEDLEAVAASVSVAVGTNRTAVFFNTADDLTDRMAVMLAGRPELAVRLGLSRLQTLDCSPETTWNQADAALCNRFIEPGLRLFAYRHAPVKMRGVLERFLQAFDRPATVVPFLAGLGEFMRRNEYGIDDALWVYNLFCVSWNHAEDQAGEGRFAVIGRHELCALFRDADEMGRFLGESAASLLRQKGTGMPASGDRFDEVLAYVEAHCQEALYLSDLAERFHYNPTYVSDLFRRRLGWGFAEQLARLRMNRARALLRETALPVTEIAARCGYADACHFARQFRKWTGLTPTAWRGMRDEPKP